LFSSLDSFKILGMSQALSLYPAEYTCPLTKHLIGIPAKIPGCNHVFDHAAIRGSFDKQKNACPLHPQDTLPNMHLVPDEDLDTRTQNYVKKLLKVEPERIEDADILAHVVCHPKIDIESIGTVKTYLEGHSFIAAKLKAHRDLREKKLKLDIEHHALDLPENLYRREDLACFQKEEIRAYCDNPDNLLGVLGKAYQIEADRAFRPEARAEVPVEGESAWWRDFKKEPLGTLIHTLMETISWLMAFVEDETLVLKAVVFGLVGGLIIWILGFPSFILAVVLCGALPYACCILPAAALMILCLPLAILNLIVALVQLVIAGD
jgi:hypothetical protein